MSRIDDIIAEESEAAEQYDDTQPLPDHVKVSRPGINRTKVFSLRLSDDEFAGIERAAEEANLPVRTLVRAWILDRLHGKNPPTVDEQLADRVARLERTVYKNQTTAKAG